MDLIFGGDNLFHDFENFEYEADGAVVPRFVRRIYHMPQRSTLNNWDDVDFFRRFRLSKTTFQFVLQLVMDELQHPHARSRYISPEQQLLITLRFMASGSMQIAVAAFMQVSAASVCRILPKVCTALIRHLDQFVQMPATLGECEAAATAFYRFAQFPRTIGAIDCTHVKLQSPGGELSEGFRNRKGWFSLNVQTISSADLKILNVVARWAGSVHDQTIFRHSNVRTRFEAGEFGSFILIGDSGYANTRYLATPYTANNPDIRQNQRMQNFQARIIRSRNVVERQYGVWKRRFPVLAYGMRVKTSTAQKIIAACAILHNICIDSNESQPPETPENEDRLRQHIINANIENEIQDAPRISRVNRNRTVREDILLQLQ